MLVLANTEISGTNLNLSALLSLKKLSALWRIEVHKEGISGYGSENQFSFKRKKREKNSLSIKHSCFVK